MNKDWNSIMFDNIGVKIKGIAKVYAWIGIVLSIIGGVVMFFVGIANIEYMGYLILLAPLSALIGCLLSWLSVVFLYGFGELIDAVCVIKRDLKRRKGNKMDRIDEQSITDDCDVQDDVQTTKEPEEEQAYVTHRIAPNAKNVWFCPRCDTDNHPASEKCWSCGTPKPVVASNADESQTKN